MNTTDVLIAARAKVESGWTKTTYARSQTRRSVKPTSPRAVSWCILGALDVAATGARHFAAYQCLAAVLPEGQHSVAGFNDAKTTEQGDVLTLFDKAIAYSEGQGHDRN